jgi:hypothetical protein
MPCVMEAFLWVWTRRMLQPLHGVGQPHKVTVFDWTEAHWEQMKPQSEAAAAAVAQALYEAKKAAEDEKQWEAVEMLKAVKRQEVKDIGTFDL